MAHLLEQRTNSGLEMRTILLLASIPPICIASIPPIVLVIVIRPPALIAPLSHMPLPASTARKLLAASFARVGPFPSPISAAALRRRRESIARRRIRRRTLTRRVASTVRSIFRVVIPWGTHLNKIDLHNKSRLP